MTSRTELFPPLQYPSDQAHQTMIRLALPLVKGNRDYRERESLLRRMDELLLLSGVESQFVEQQVARERAADESAHPGMTFAPLTDCRRARLQQGARQALRCTIARVLSNESHRSFSVHLAESPLLQWFCGIPVRGDIGVPSKSQLQRMESSVPTSVLQDAQRRLLQQAAGCDAAGVSEVQLAEPVDVSAVWMDATCAQLNIHYPVDWLLLRDATRTIMKAILTIRRHGLISRMPAPESFIAEMNQQTMAMSAASRRGRGSDKKRARKCALRKMKACMRTVVQHGRRYCDLLKKSWSQTDVSWAQAQVIITRIDHILATIPAAVYQAHERIIGERVVPNHQKIFSFYQPQARIYVRGKSGSDVEFGLQLLLSESVDGLILDCHLIDGGIVNDSTLLLPAITRIRTALGDSAASTAVTDRGFTSAANNAALAALGIHNATLPRNPAEMHEHLADPANRKLHTRRAQTEARIGIFKANCIGDYLPTQSVPAQQRYIAWAALAHNLWVLARLDRLNRTQSQRARAS